MKLIDYIQEQHNGNVSAFAKSQGVRPFQVDRWLKRDCVWRDGGIWCRITKQSKLKSTLTTRRISNEQNES